MTKQLFALIMCAILLIALSACGISKTGEPAKNENGENVTPTEDVTVVSENTEVPIPSETIQDSASSTNKWVLCKTVDEFGDETSTYVIGTTHIIGSFSNTATNDSKLGVTVFYVPYLADNSMWYIDEDGHESIKAYAENTMVFHLQEYDSVNAVYSSDKEMSIKFKIGQDVYEAELYGNAPNGYVELSGLAISQAPISQRPVLAMTKALSENETVRCIITIGSSKYKFDIDGTEFKEAYTELETAYNLPSHRYK